MRIVAGRAGGTRLTAPPGLALRPTSDRVREALFASLGDLRGWCVADLFAGTGALGLEALSRGAAQVFLVERHPSGVRCIRENLARTQKAMGDAESGTVRILRADAFRAPVLLADCTSTLDLVLADPPYAADAEQESAATRLLQDARTAAWAAGAVLVLEHRTNQALPWSPAFAWKLLRQRRFGGTTLSFAVAAAGSDAGTKHACHATGVDTSRS